MMRTALQTLGVAFSLFSALPMPQFPWNETNMRRLLLAFPLVGALLGLLFWAVCALCRALALPPLMQGALLCLTPVVFTGGIHLDGYADTCDALASHQSPQRRQEILADAHCGAFAVIRVCAYFVASFALCGTLPLEQETILCLALGFSLSRALSALAIVAFPLARDSGLAHQFAAAANRPTQRRILSLLCAALLIFLCLLGRGRGALMALAALFTWGRYHRMAVRKFGGVSGDLAGWFLQTCEGWMLAAAVLYSYGEAMF